MGVRVLGKSGTIKRHGRNESGLPDRVPPALDPLEYIAVGEGLVYDLPE